MPVFVRSIMDGNKIRLRAIEGQKYDTKKNVQGSREMRHSNPLGTIFECDGLENAGSFYRAVGGLDVARNVPVQYDPTILRTKKTREKTSPINVVEFV
jgi:hypothetical protein